MEIIAIEKYSETVLSGINNLLPGLSSSAKSLDEDALKKILDNPAVHVLIAEENSACLGTLSLVVFPITTGIRARVEDVVVCESARGKGVGKMLIKHAIELAKSLGAKTIDLTSRPSKTAANNLYKNVGFEARETSVYRLSIEV